MAGETTGQAIYAELHFDLGVVAYSAGCDDLCEAEYVVAIQAYDYAALIVPYCVTAWARPCVFA